MKASSWQGLDTAARTLTPTLLLVALVFLGQLPFSPSRDGSTTPYFVLMAVFYWGLHRPDLLPAAVVFVVGLLHDALELVPFGINAFVLIAVYWLVISQRRHFRGRAFPVIWLGFAVAAFMATALRWILVSIMLSAAMSPWAVLLQFLMTVIFYPVLTVAFALVQKTVPRSRASEFVE